MTPEFIKPDAPLPAIVIDILIECYVCPTPGSNVFPSIWNSTAAREVRHFLALNGMIDPATNRTTPAGNKWMQRICATPMPVTRTIEAVEL